MGHHSREQGRLGNPHANAQPAYPAAPPAYPPASPHTPIVQRTHRVTALQSEAYTSPRQGYMGSCSGAGSQAIEVAPGRAGQPRVVMPYFTCRARRTVDACKRCCEEHGVCARSVHGDRLGKEVGGAVPYRG